MIAQSLGTERRSVARKPARVKISARMVMPDEFRSLLSQIARPDPEIPALVHPDKPDRSFWVVSRDLSCAGLSVAVDFDAFQPGRDFILDLHLPGLKPAVRAVGQVIWELPQPEGCCKAGFMFTVISEKDRERLRKFLDGR